VGSSDCSHRLATDGFEGHLDAHSGNKPYVCGYNCGKAFTRKSDCKRHEHTVHDPAPHFVCETCKRSFARRDHFQKHSERLNDVAPPIPLILW
jgi:hypothetical protein